MSERPAPADLFDRYLNVLGVHARAPSLDALSELVAAHLTRIPFENVSKLYYRNDPARCGLPGLAQFLGGIERYRFGGTCYANNFHLHQLLVRLGYQVTLCGADMSSPNVHMVNIVTLSGRRFLVDGGYGAPFLEPLPLDAPGDCEIAWGAYRYVLKPSGADGRTRLDMCRDGVVTHGYTVNPIARSIGDFAGVIADSFTDRATFMHALFIARFWAHRSVTLRNLTLETVEGTASSRREVPGPEYLPATIEQEFGMPRDIVRQALDGVSLSSPL